MMRYAAALCVALAFLGLAPDLTHADPRGEFKVVAVSGQRAAGLPQGVVFQVFLDFDVNDAGQIAFRAGLSGDGVGMTNDAANFLGDGRSVRLLARDGDQAAGLPAGVRYQGLCYFCAVGEIPGPRISNGGRTAFTTLLGGNGIDFTGAGWGLFSDVRTATLDAVLATGQPAPPQPPDVEVAIIEAPFLAKSGSLAFAVGLKDPEIPEFFRQAIIAGPPDNLRLVVRADQQAAGLPQGYTYRYLNLSGLTSAGRVVFTGLVQNSSDLHSQETDIFAERGGGVRLIVRQGDPAPGLAGGIVFGSLHPPSVSTGGDIAFLSFLKGPDIDTFKGNHMASFVERDGSFEPVARLGGQAAGLPPGNSYSFLSSPQINVLGQVAFLAFLNGRSATDIDDQAIFSDAGGVLRAVARTGDPVADLPGGVTFDEFGFPRLNNAGQIVFSATLSDGLLHPSLFLAEPDGRILLLLRPGDVIEVAPGNARPVGRVGSFELTDAGIIGVQVSLGGGYSPSSALLVGRAE